MAEFPLVVGSGVQSFDGVGLFVGEDGLLYHQDSDGNRVSVGAALAGALTGADSFFAIGHLSPTVDNSGAGYNDQGPLIIHGVEAPIFAVGPADTADMLPGNFSFELDLEGGRILFSALDDDGNVLTGEVALA